MMTLEILAQRLRDSMNASPVPDGAAALCAILGEALKDRRFTAAMLPDRKDGEAVREILYEDPELGFCICGHVNAGSSVGKPHDHGTTWAIYGQAEGTTEMTDWRIVDHGGDDNPIRVVPDRTYTMKPGDAHFYGVGAVHSPRRTRPTRLIRIEGANQDFIPRSPIVAAEEALQSAG
ncbi:MAG: hypothetical protein F4027_08100 [Rhodospirillaceae bacterium]|nr:hypothetical protein [Rhodospirillaceae bacterium]MYH36623.1 hypothetical protein [Rhodospirillaceae bacterium]MYK13471.1 hypothetical protein [Rhodospirillaceae bacterium]MYK58558.1 hypothetical protein [Rhodospirillaceae bacterium]